VETFQTAGDLKKVADFYLYCGRWEVWTSAQKRGVWLR